MKIHWTLLSPFILAIALCPSAYASPIVVTGTTVAFGNITTTSTGTSSSITVSQFDLGAVNAAIQAGCPTHFVCSAATLTEIDEALTATLSGSITTNNVSGSTKYIASIQSSSDEGTFGAPTSGIALTQTVGVTLNDPFQNAAVSETLIQTVATTNQYKGTGAGTGTCGATGTATSSKFVNCLAVPTGGNAVHTGTASATGGNSYLSTDSEWNNELAPFVGSGNVAFTLNAASGVRGNGTLSGITFPAMSGTITAMTNGLEVDYNYSYTESPPPVPEPAAIYMLGSGLLSLGFMRRRGGK